MLRRHTPGLSYISEDLLQEESSRHLGISCSCCPFCPSCGVGEFINFFLTRDGFDDNLFPWLRFYCNTVQRSPQVKWTRRSRWTFLALYLFHSRIWVHLHLIFWWIHEENSRSCWYLSCRAPFWPRCPVSCRSRLSLKVTSVACTLKWRLSSSVVTI